MKLLLTGTLALFCLGNTTAKAGLANANSDAKTVAVYQFITGMTSGSSNRVLSGQNVLWYEPSSNGDTYMNDLIWNLQNQTGEFPAIVGADLNDTNTNARILPELVTLSQTTGCLVEIDGGLTYPNQTSGQSLTHLLPGGADNAAWVASMQALATKLQYLQSCGLTVLFRPLHEMNGSWCPYYTTDTASFQNLWINLYNYMTQTAGLNNLIWVFAPNNAGGNTAYNQLVSQTEYCDNSHVQTVTLNNLTVGQTYQVQLWSAYVNGGNRGAELDGSNGTASVTLNSGTGQYAVGTFTASATSLSITATPAAANTLAGTGWSADAFINAISVRAIAGSAGSQIQWGVAQSVGTESDILTNGTYFDAALFNSSANGGSPLTVNGVTFNIVAAGTSGVTDPSGHIGLTSQRNLRTGGNSPSGPPSAMPYYPGGTYVDIVGSDCYGDSARMTEYAWFNQLGKPILYTEFGNGPATSAGTYNGTYNYETQLMPVIKNTYPNIVGFIAWSDWSVSGNWVYKSIARNVDGGMMNDPWVVTASDLKNNGLGTPVSGLTGYYKITNQSNGQALTCDSMTQGDTAYVASYGDYVWQQWGLAPDESGSGYTITDEWSGQVLFCPNQVTSGSTQIQQYGQASWQHYTWNITGNGDGTYTIYNAYFPTMCLDLNGTNVVIATHTGAASQKWTLTSLFATPTTVTFQQGVNGYSGAAYTTILGSNPLVSQQDWRIYAFGLPGDSNQIVGLLQFNNLFGGGTGQVPAGSTISSATITYTIYTDWGGTMYNYPMLTSWDPATVCDSYRAYVNGSPTAYWGNGSTATVGPVSGVDFSTTLGASVAIAGTRGQTLTIDVTNIVKQWQSGTLANHGLALFGSGTYLGAMFYSPSYGATGPLLSITYTQ